MPLFKRGELIRGWRQICRRALCVVFGLWKFLCVPVGVFYRVCVCVFVCARVGELRKGVAPDSQECQCTGNGRSLWSNLLFILFYLFIFLTLVFLSGAHTRTHAPANTFLWIPEKGGDGSGEGVWVEGIVSTLFKRVRKGSSHLPRRAQVSPLLPEESAGTKRRSLMERNNR